METIKIENARISVYRPEWDMASSSQGYKCSFELVNSIERISIKIRYNYFLNSNADWSDWEFSINDKNIETIGELENIIEDSSGFDSSKISQCICSVVFLLHLLNPEIDDSLLSIGTLPILSIDNYFEWEELEPWMDKLPQKILIRENLILDCEEIIELQKFNEENKPLQLEHVTSFISESIIDSDVQTDDGGQALIYSLYDDDKENGLFVRIQSWDESKEHEDFKKLVGKRIKVTIETIVE